MGTPGIRLTEPAMRPPDRQCAFAPAVPGLTSHVYRRAGESGSDDDFHAGCGEGGSKWLGRRFVGDEHVDEVEWAQDHGLLAVELGVVGGDDDAVGQPGEETPDLDLGGVEVGDAAVDGQTAAAEDQQVEVDLGRLLHYAGVDQAELG